MSKTIGLKYILIGDTGVGKSSLMNQYLDNKFDPYEKTTIGINFGMKRIKSKDKDLKCEIKIWDLTGNIRFKNIIKIYYNDANCALVVFDLSNRETFDNLNHWFESIKANCNKNPTILLVGNFSDKNRQVSYKEAIEKANSNGAIYIETSCSTNMYVDDVFKISSTICLNKLETKQGGLSYKSDTDKSYRYSYWCF